MLNLARFLALPVCLIFILFQAGLADSVSEKTETDHPRLFLEDGRLQEIRDAMKVEESHHSEALQVIKEKVGGGYEAFGATESNWNYARSYLAQSAAFLYQLTKEKTYAEIAYQTLVDIHKEPDPDGRLPEKGYGLSRATVGLGFALAYDWCYEAWTPNQRNYIRERIMVALDAWETYYHPNIDHTYGSNWTAVCRGGELIMMLAVGEEQNRSGRYETIKNHLKKHIKNGYDNLGVSQEGIGYTSYGGIFLLPAIYAAQSVGDNGLYNYAREIEWHKQAMYAGSFTGIPHNGRMSGQKIYLMSGVGGPTISEEGWASLLLNWPPEEDLPYYLWWYDRHTGKYAVPQDDPGQRYDYKRQGTIWAMLYYPGEIESRNPTDLYPKAITSNWGQTFFRNRWKDSNDILANLIADGSDHSHAWSQTEAGQIGLIGYKTMFIGGPNKERNPKYYSKILINGKTGQSNTTGMPISFESFESGGYAVVDGGEQYHGLGIDSYQRHMLVEFSESGNNEAVIAIFDRLDAAEEMEYIWNLNYDSHKSHWDLSVDTGEVHDIPTVTITGKDGATFCAWILVPEEVKIQAGQSIQIKQRADSANYFVLSWVGRGNVPGLNNIQKGKNGIKVRVGSHIVGLDRTRNRLLHGDEARNFDPGHSGSGKMFNPVIE